jgi:hypothetical protein
MRVARSLAPLGAVGLVWSLGSIAAAGPAPPPPPEAQQPQGQPQQGQPQQGQPQQGQPQQGQPQQGQPQQGSGAAPPPPGSGAAPPPPGTAPAAPSARGAVDDEPADLSHTWTYSRRRAAPEPRYTRPPDQTVAPNPKGFYSGVSSRGNQVPPAPPADLGTTPTLLTWTGFERIEGGTQIYFQLSADVAYDVTETPGRIVIQMKNVRANARNNLRPLDLRYFATPARSVKLRKRGKDLVATIDLKRRTTATIEQVPGQAGYRMLVVRFDEAKPEALGDPPARR